MIGLRRSLQSYANCTPEGVSGGSLAQMQYFVADAKADIATLARKIETDPVRIALRKMIDFMKSFNGFADGYCMCGDSIESHNPHHSNHSPVDAGEYHVALLIEEAEKALS